MQVHARIHAGIHACNIYTGVHAYMHMSRKKIWYVQQTRMQYEGQTK